MKCRVFREPGGNVRIIFAAPKHRRAGESDDTFLGRTSDEAVAGDPTLGGLPFVDIDEAVVRSMDRSKRHKWRIQGSSVAVDNAVPDRPDPDQLLLNRIDAAPDLTAMKAVLKDILRRR